jgi:hypothetical protein
VARYASNITACVPKNPIPIGLNDLFVILARPTIRQRAALPFAQITAPNNGRCGKSALVIRRLAKTWRKMRCIKHQAATSRHSEALPLRGM